MRRRASSRKFQRGVGIATLGEDNRPGAQSLGIGGLQPQGVIEGDDGRAIAAEGAQDKAVIVIGCRVGKAELLGLVESGGGLFKAAEPLQHARKPHDGVEEIGPQGARLREPRHRGGPGLRAKMNEAGKLTALRAADLRRVEARQRRKRLVLAPLPQPVRGLVERGVDRRIRDGRQRADGCRRWGIRPGHEEFPDKGGANGTDAGRG